MFLPKRLWQIWKRFFAIIGDFQAKLLFSFIYFFIGLPFALLVKWIVRPFFSANSDSCWQEENNRKEKTDDLERHY